MRREEFILTPELSKLKEYLEGNHDVIIDRARLLGELAALEKGDIESLCESLALSSRVCRACGRPL